MERIKILIADSNEIFRAGIRTLLAREKNILVVATASNAEETFLKIRRRNPNIVVLDLCSSSISTGEVTDYIINNFPNVKVIIYTTENSKKCIAEGFRAGAFGYVLKNNSANHLREAINAVSIGEKYAGSNVMDICLNKFIDIISNGDSSENKDIEHTDNDIVILKLLCEGKKLSEISERLKIKVRSVSKRKQKLMKKIQINDMPGLMKYAIKNGIVEV